MRTLEYMKECFKIMFKRLIEYKINFYNTLIVQLFFTSAFFLLNFVVAENFGEIIGWKYYEFLIYILIIDLLWQINGIFIWGKWSISNSIISGTFNSYLFKPLPVKVQHYFSELSSVALLYFITTILILIGVIIYFNVTVYFSLNLILFFCLIASSLFFIHEAISSTGFYIKKLDETIHSFFWVPYHTMGNYPYPFFKKFPFQKILYLIPFVFIATLLMPELLGQEKEVNVMINLIILVGINIFFTLIYFINWHIGLKKYEAYN